MTPDEVCEALISIGASVSRRSLLHYEEAELIPKPARGGGGKSGRFTNYPNDTVAEAFAAWSLLHGKYGLGKTFFGGNTPKLSPSAIKYFRSSVLSRVSEEEAEKIMNELVAEHYDGDYNKYHASCTMSEEDKDAFVQSLKEKEEEMNEYDKLKEMWNDCRRQSSFRIKNGFMELWESEVLRAKLLLIDNKNITPPLFVRISHEKRQDTTNKI